MGDSVGELGSLDIVVEDFVVEFVQMPASLNFYFVFVLQAKKKFQIQEIRRQHRRSQNIEIMIHITVLLVCLISK